MSPVQGCVGARGATALANYAPVYSGAWSPTVCAIERLRSAPDWGPGSLTLAVRIDGAVTPAPSWSRCIAVPGAGLDGG